MISRGRWSLESVSWHWLQVHV